MITGSLATPNTGSLGVFTRMVEYMTDEGIIVQKPCGLIQQQGDVCFITPLATAAQFSESLDQVLEVFHGLGLYRSDWLSGNGVWSTRVIFQPEYQSLEIFIAERSQYGAQYLEGVFFQR